MERLKYINEIKCKCSIITRWDLREATEGLKFDKTEWNWSMGDNQTRYVKGKPVTIGKVVYNDMIVYKDKNGKSFSYQVGATMDTIEFKANEASKILSSLPKYLQENIDGFVFAGRPHPLDKYYYLAYYPNFKGAAYSGRTITVHSKYSSNNFARMACHEAGHNIDTKRLFLVRKGKKWKDAIAKEGYTSDYSMRAQSPEEDFADSMKSLVNDKTDFKKKFPNKYKLIEELLKSIGHKI